MSVELWKKAKSNVAEIQVSGKLSEADYEKFVPELEKMIDDQGKIRLLFKMEDFEGWKLGALWKDLKFDLEHFDDVERVAFVGERKWQEGLAQFSRPFTTADIRYFEQSDVDAARTWLQPN